MVRNNNYFYLSGFLAFSLFTFFIVVVFFMMINSETNNVFALKKDNYISVSVDMSIKQAKKTISTLSKPVVKENIVENKVKNLNIDKIGRAHV